MKFESLEDLETHVQTDHPEVSPETSAAAKKAEASPAPKVRLVTSKSNQIKTVPVLLRRLSKIGLLKFKDKSYPSNPKSSVYK